MTGREPIAVPDATPESLDVIRERAQKRIRFVSGILLCLTFLVATRGLQLAVSPDPKTLAIATDKRWAAVSTQGPRGEIFDADGNALAMSVRTPAIFVDPAHMREREVDLAYASTELARLLELPLERVEKALASKGRYVRLTKGVHPRVVDELHRLGLAGRGLIIEENYRRYYPQGALAAQTLGFLNASGTAVQGMERSLDTVLSGAQRVSQHRVNSRGKVLELATRDDRSIQGKTVHSTIDRVIQRSAERALAEVMERSVPSWATAVVVEVKTGRILAMATTPGFNPNLPSDDFDSMRNRAVADAIEPGSVMKPFTMALAVEAGLARPNEVLMTKSPYFIGGVPFRDDHPHPRVTVMEMVKYSSNIGSAQLAMRVGAEGMVAGFEAFGFGAPTGVLTSGEAAGRRHPYGGVGPTELATISFGQGLTATAMQLAMATAALANDGKRMRPILVDRVEDSYGKVRQEYPPVLVQQVVSPATARAVRQAMQMVMEPGGTADHVRVPGYRVGGKTGTAEKVKNGAYSKVARYATFIGYAPADQPDIAMAVIVDEPTVGSRYGGTVAGPVFAEVASVALRHRGVPPDFDVTRDSHSDDVEPEERPEVEPIRLAWGSGGWQMPDLSGRCLRDALAGLQGAGLTLSVEGTGILVEQQPSPGTTLAPGDAVTLRFQ